MVLLIYAFWTGSQLMMGMAEFDSLERCHAALPTVSVEYRGAGAACIVVKK